MARINIEQLIHNITPENLAIAMSMTPYVDSNLEHVTIPLPEYNKYLKGYISKTRLLHCKHYKNMKVYITSRYFAVLLNYAPHNQYEKLFLEFNADLDKQLPALFFYNQVKPDMGMYAALFANIMNKHINIITKEFDSCAICAYKNCENTANVVCVRCKVARYCCKSHLKKDLVNHRLGCIKYREAMEQ